MEDKLNRKKISVLGLGYIGLPTSLLFSREGHDVIGVDIDQDKITKLSQGILPFEEIGLNELFNEVKDDFFVSTSLDRSDVFVICTPTPIDLDKKCDLSFVLSAAESIRNVLKKGDLVILESTVSPRVTVDVLKPFLEKNGLICGEDFYLAYVPEKAIPGRTLYEMQNNVRLIGGFCQKSAEMSKELYSFVKSELIITDATTCETVKLLENTYRDVNIALANDFLKLSEKFQINIHEAIKYANYHPRVQIHMPGPGVGGHCIPIDPYFLIEGLTNKEKSLISLSREINESMENLAINFIESNIEKSELKGMNLAVLGVSYKPNIDDLRESSGIKIFEKLKNKGYTVSIVDPFFTKNNLPNLVSLNDSFKISDVLIISTAHNVFTKLKPEDFSESKVKMVIDLQNCLNCKFELENMGIEVKTFGDYK